MPGHPDNLLEPNRLVNSHNVRMEDGVIIAEGEDAYLIFRPQSSVSAGCFAVDLNIEDIDGAVSPRIYINAGRGLSRESSAVMPRTSPGHYRIYFSTVGKVRSVRLDPSELPSRFKLRQFEIRRVSFGTFAVRAMRNGAGYGEEKSQFRRLPRAALNILRFGFSYDRVDASLTVDAQFDPVSITGLPPNNLLAGCRLTALHNLKMRDGVMIAAGEDPYMVLRPRGFARLGTYVADLEIEEIAGDIRPRLYVNAGGGFTQASSDVMRRIAPGRYRSYFCAFWPIRAVRFDPADFGCEFKLHRLVVRRMGPLRFLARLLRNGEIAGEGTPQYRRLRKAAARVLRSGLTYDRVEGLGRDQDRDAQFARWKAIYDFDETQEARCRDAVEALGAKPLISIVMPVYNTPAALLTAVITSVKAQIYPNWELCIADDASTSPHVRTMLEKHAAEDSRIKVAYRERNGHIAAATNTAFGLVTGDYVALLDHDDELRPHALAEVALTLASHPDAELIYSDEDKIDSLGRRFDPYFKPQWNPELLLCQNYFNHLTVHRTENIQKAGGWRSGFDGSQDWDLNLRITGMIDTSKIIHIPKILYHWRATETSAASSATQKGYAVVNGGKALEEHASRLGIAGTVEEVGGTTWFRIKRSLPDPAPRVSILIPTRNGRDILKQCIDSIRQRTDYPDYEIIVIDNNSDEPASLAYLKEIAARGHARVIAYPHPFNYSAINNFAAGHATGQLLLLLNNDIEVISRGWLTEMAALALAPGAGCVGAMLYYPDDTIQHAGIVLGIGGVAGHSHKRFERGRSGYYGMLKLPHNVSAVTGACLLVPKAIYEEVGGLDEVNLKVAFNDVDFCLKVREAGYRNVWTPFAELYHHESLSRGVEDTPEKKERFKSEVLHMLARWGDTLREDPYYSPHLTLRREDFSLKLE